MKSMGPTMESMQIHGRFHDFGRFLWKFAAFFAVVGLHGERLRFFKGRLEIYPTAERSRVLAGRSSGCSLLITRSFFEHGKEFRGRSVVRRSRTTTITRRVGQAVQRWLGAQPGGQ